MAKVRFWKSGAAIAPLPPPSTLQFLKRYCIPGKGCNFIFSSETLHKIWLLKKPRTSQSCLDQKLCQFLFVHCAFVFDKLSKLGQISCEVSYYIEIKGALYLGMFFANLLENWYKMRKIIALH